ncbi:MAG TPA: putative sulfate exporter family transporter [Magnetospirillaceae bacterium]|jgi:uncharacterized integral membrane protein (TIGR00698 family)
MTSTVESSATGGVSNSAGGWGDLWRKEDWWAIWIGLGLLVAALLFFAGDSTGLKWIAVAPAKWADFGQLGDFYATNWIRFVAQFVLWGLLFGAASSALGFKLRSFLASFAGLYILSIVVLTVGAWAQASKYNLEPPLVALVLGLLVVNLNLVPRSLDAGFRVEFYIKTGIVLLGATLPLNLILWAGPLAILQASIISIITFLTIYFVARRLGLDHHLAAVLGVGGSVCGVSAAIAVSGAIGARKEVAPIAITLVILWAIVMIFVLPIVARSLGLPTGVAGAWIGSSEFADAAGIAAAQTYAGYAGTVPGIDGNGEQAVAAFTLMKVIGRDVWIGVWALVLALISITRWEENRLTKNPTGSEVWKRFPKFVLGFIIASIIVSIAASGHAFADYNKTLGAAVVAPVKDLRTWAFTFGFLSIGLSTRFSTLAKAGRKPFLAFTSGVAVNVVLGFLLSAVVFAGYWTTLGK